MKRMWFGIGLLALMLICSLCATDFMEQAHSAGAEDLNRAAELALQEEWDKAEVYALRARKNWNEKRLVTAMFADHEPMNEIDALFAQLDAYASARDSASFGSTCRNLAVQLNTLKDAHRLSFGNLL